MVNQKRKVLVVEDDVMLNQMYRLKLEHDGYLVDNAANGEMAWQKIQKNKPDVVITDLMMPRMTGLELLDRVRSHNDTKKLPVVIISNADSPNYQKQAKKLKADAFLLKANYTPAQIVKKAKAYLK